MDAGTTAPTLYLRHGLRLCGRSALVQLRHRGLRDHDAYLASYPKSGNTWLRSLLATLLLEREVEIHEVDRVIPPVGRHVDAPCLLRRGGRLLKTHERHRPVYGRGIYLVRDPRAVAVSYFHGLRRMGRIPGSMPFESFLRYFVSGHLDGYGTWQAHVHFWLDRIQGDPRWLVLTYENLTRDTGATLRNALSSLGLNQPSDDWLQEAIRLNSKELLRRRERRSTRMAGATRRSGMSFFRDSAPGDWRMHFDDKGLAYYDELTRLACQRIALHPTTIGAGE